MPEEKEDAPRQRVLMCAADWKDPECRRVISEYHKEGLDTEILDVDQDLQLFENKWGDAGPAKFHSEYHKEGAPFLENEGLDDYVPSSEPTKRREPPANRPALDRKIDMGTVEVIAYALFRAVFGHGVKVPIRRPGVVDMDITIKGKDVIVNTNDFYFNLPDLVVWRVVYSHQGIPIIELGRGVDKGFKVHRLNSLRLLLDLRSKSKQATKARIAARKAAATEMAREKEGPRDKERSG